VADEREATVASHDLRAPGPLELGAPGFGGGALITEADLTEVEVREGAASARPGGGPGRGRGRFSHLGWWFWLSVAIVALWVLAAIFANVLPLPNPNTVDVNCLVSTAPSSAHLLGCDTAGRDILSRVIFGSRVSLVVGFASIAISEIVGGILGLLAGYFRGWFDEVLAIVSNSFLSFPFLVLALVMVAYVGRSLLDITLIIALLAWPILFRVVRAATIEYAQRDYVLATRALGAKSWRVLVTLLLPDVIPAAVTFGLVGVAVAVVGEGSLSFLGLSVPAPTATWGNMIAQGSTSLTTDLSLLLSPAVAMFSFILAINFIGDRLRGVLDVRQGVL
jgi:peptide/nickel transport system permease protein